MLFLYFIADFRIEQQPFVRFKVLLIVTRLSVHTLDHLGIPPWS
jgi:hypothetical protein